MIEVVSRSCLALIIICASQFPVRAQATSGPPPKSRVTSTVNIPTSGDQAPAGGAPVRGRAHEEASKASYDLGVRYGLAGRYKEAIEAFKEAILYKPTNAEAHNNLGVAYYLVGRYADAAKALERAMRLAPNDPVIRSNLRQTSLNGGGAATGEPVALVNTGVAGTGAKGLRWLSRSDLVRGLRGGDDPYVSANPPAAEAKNKPAPPRKEVTPEAEPAVTNAPPAKVVPLKTDTPHAETKDAPPPAGLYRLGVGDVLDIRLLNERTDKSTLYTVLPGGLLEYPLFSEPLSVEGQTVEEAAERIAQELRRRAIEDDPQVLVNVREYVSHSVIVSGLVAEPGTKILRREEVPLYVLIAEAQPLPEAGRVLLTSHATGLRTEVALEDQAALAAPVRRGDVLMVTKRSQQFYYVGGDVVSPGQKEFHPEITLTQAIIAAGGELHRLRTVTRWWNHNAPPTGVIASPEGKGAQPPKGGGLLTSTTYSLRDILSGKVPDPRIMPGDRIEASR